MQFLWATFLANLDGEANEVAGEGNPKAEILVCFTQNS